MEFLTRFTPARPCSDVNCIAMTTTGLAERCQDAAFKTYPYCPRHGYLDPVRPHQHQDEQDTIALFVLSENGDQGQVQDIISVPLEEAAEHHISVRPCDKAWLVKYKSDEGRNAFYVVWSGEFTEFSLHRKEV